MSSREFCGLWAEAGGRYQQDPTGPGDAFEQRGLGRLLALVQVGNGENFNSLASGSGWGVRHTQGDVDVETV